MRVHTLAIALCVSGALAGSALALNPDDELWVPAAARGQGAGQSLWRTDLQVLNLGEEAVTVEISWLERDADNEGAASELFEIEGGATLVLEDAILEVFGLETAGGAFHIEVLGEDEEEKTLDRDDPRIIAQARIYSIDEGGETVGQGFEGIVSNAAIDAEASDTTHAVGITHDARFRSNWYGVNTSEDDTEVLVELLDDAGEVLGEADYTMPPFAPMLRSIAELGAQGVANAVVRFTVMEGSGIFGVSKIDRLTEDPTTLETHWDCGPGMDDLEFTDEFFIEDCTFISTGSHPFFIPLNPGHQMFYEGEEDGETVELRITILNETEMVDGVETRVLEEYETVDGDLVEISRNFLAICVETGSVFYFGEDVDIYEDGEIVSHEGAWRAGEDGAEAGILMPGTVLLGSRYYQEVAPGVALDRAHHTAMDVTVDTPAGTFTDCLRVDETTPLEPDLSLKFYAPGVGLVRDDILDLVEVVEP